MSQAKSKPCQLCRKPRDIRYRIQYREEADWVLVCPECWQQVSRDNPYYRYGGTWKARKK